jgi:hypothetical protein
LLDFAYRPLDRLGPGALADLALELRAFAMPVLADEVIYRVDSPPEILRPDLADPCDRFEGVPGIQLALRHWLDLLSKVMRGIATALDRDALDHNTPSAVSVYPRVQEGRLRFLMSATGLVPALKLTFGNLIETTPRPIRSCLECGRLFLPTKRQAYCSSRCGYRARKHRYVTKHKETVNQKRRAAYKRKRGAGRAAPIRIQPRKRRD